MLTLASVPLNQEEFDILIKEVDNDGGGVIDYAVRHRAFLAPTSTARSNCVTLNCDRNLSRIWS
eukprot:COSAG01_NODE_15854_length_1292_cov_0.897737_2_plen_63_part_01